MYVFMGMSGYRGMGATISLADPSDAQPFLDAAKGVVKNMATFAVGLAGLNSMTPSAQNLAVAAVNQFASQISVSDVLGNNVAAINAAASQAIQWAYNQAMAQTGGNSQYPDGSGRPAGGPIAPNSPVGLQLATNWGSSWGFGYPELQAALAGNADVVGIVVKSSPRMFGGTVAPVQQYVPPTVAQQAAVMAQWPTAYGVAAQPGQTSPAPVASYSPGPIQQTVTQAGGAAAAPSQQYYPSPAMQAGTQIYQPSATPAAGGAPTMTASPVATTDASGGALAAQSSGSFMDSITSWITANPIIAGAGALGLLFMFSQGQGGRR